MNGTAIPYSKIKLYLFMAVVLVFSFTALSGYGRITNAIAACCIPAFFFIEHRLGVKKEQRACLIAFLLFFLYDIVISAFNCDSWYYFFGTVVLWTFIEFMPLIILTVAVRKDDKTLIPALYRFFTVIWFIFVIISIFTFLDADIGGRDFAQESRGYFIGGAYSLAYGSVLIACVYTNYLLAGKIKKNRVPYVIGIILLMAHVMVTQSVITILALAAGLMFTVLLNGRKTKYYKYRIFIGSAIIVVGVVFFVTHVKPIGAKLISIAGNVENEIFSQRIKEIGMMLFSNTETYHVSLRVDTLGSSLQTFIDHPFFGVAYTVGNQFELLNEAGVGTHSEILDTLARYGLVGAIPFFLTYFYHMRYMFRISTTNLAVPFCAAILVLATLNPFLSVQTGFVVFLYVPLFLLHKEGGCRQV